MNKIKYFLTPYLLLILLVPGLALAQFSQAWNLIKAIKDKNIPDIEKALGKGAVVNVWDENGVPALTLAVELKNKEILDILVENGANLDFGDEQSGDSALMDLAVIGDVEMSTYLIEKGADVNYQNRNGETALIKAVLHRKTRIIRYLIEQGADANLNDYTGRSAKDYAAISRSSRLIRMFDGL